MTKPPHADTRLALYIQKRLLELRAKKSQIEIANEAGFNNPNILSMLKNGASKLPLDRVAALAKALECDPPFLFKLAVEQLGGDTAAHANEEIFGVVVSVMRLPGSRNCGMRLATAIPTSRARGVLQSVGYLANDIAQVRESQSRCGLQAAG